VLSSLLPALMATLLAALLVLPHPALAAQPEHYRCAGDPLEARVDNGAVDAAGIPNTAAGTVPGAFVVLHWRGIVLQLPRTNNAGAPSFTDGKWWWSLEDPDHPLLQLRTSQRRAGQVRSGGVETFDCSRIADQEQTAAA
jgi:hypothetical protein